MPAQASQTFWDVREPWTLEKVWSISDDKLRQDPVLREMFPSFLREQETYLQLLSTAPHRPATEEGQTSNFYGNSSSPVIFRGSHTGGSAATQGSQTKANCLQNPSRPPITDQRRKQIAHAGSIRWCVTIRRPPQREVTSRSPKITLGH